MTGNIVRVEPTEIDLDGGVAPRLRSFLDTHYLQNGILPNTATIVARKGKIGLWETQGMADIEGGVPLGEDHIFRIYSMTKPIVSIALLQLYEKGLVLLEDPIHRFIPEFRNVRVFNGGTWPNYLTKRTDNPIRVRDLLTHTSGLTYDFLYKSNVDYGYRKEKLGHLNSPDTLEEACQKLAKLPLEFSPGEKWNYSMATDVVGRLVEVISGMPLDDYLKREIFTPLGMVDTDFWVPPEKIDRLTACYERPLGASVSTLQDSPRGGSNFSTKPTFLSGGGGLVSTMSDYHRFASMLACQGTVNGTRIIGKKTLELAFMNHLPGNADMTDFGVPSTFTETPYKGVGFGLGFSVALNPAESMMSGSVGEVGWGGLASTSFWVDPKEELSVVFMTQLIPSSITVVRRHLHAIIHSGLL